MARKGSLQFEIERVKGKNDQFNKIVQETEAFYDRVENNPAQINIGDVKHTVIGLQQIAQEINNIRNNLESNSGDLEYANVLDKVLDKAEDKFERIGVMFKNVNNDTKKYVTGFADIYRYLGDSNFGIKFLDVGAGFKELQDRAEELYDSLKLIGEDTFQGGKFELWKGSFDQHDLIERIDLLRQLKWAQEEMLEYDDSLRARDFITGQSVSSLEDYVEASEKQLELLRKSGLETTKELERQRDAFTNKIDGGSWDKYSYENAKEHLGDKELFESYLQDLKSFINERENLLKSLDSGYEQYLFTDDEIYNLKDTLGEQLSNAKIQLKELEQLGDVGKNIDFTEVVEALKEIKNAIKEIKDAFEPLTTALNTEGNAFSNMAKEGSASLDTLLEKLKELGNAMDSLNQKDFNVTNLITQKSNVSDSVNTLKGQAKILLDVVKTLIDAQNEVYNTNNAVYQSAMRSGIGGSLYELAGFDIEGMSKKLSKSGSETKLLEHISTLEYYKDLVLKIINAINEVSPNTIDTTSILSKLNAIQKAKSDIDTGGGQPTRSRDSFENLVDQIKSENEQIESELKALRQQIEATFDLSTIDMKRDAFSAILDSIYQQFVDLQSKIKALDFGIKTQSVVVEAVHDETKKTDLGADKTVNDVSAENQEVYKTESVFTDAAIAKGKFADANRDAAKTAQDTVKEAQKEEEAIKEVSQAAKDAAKNLENAKNKIKTPGEAAVLRGLTQADFEDYAAQIAANQGMTLDNVSVTLGENDNMRLATVKMVNEELAQSITYTYQLIQLEDDLTEAYLTSATHTGNINKAQKLAIAQQKRADKEKYKNTKWLIQQQAALDRQEQKYKYSGKKIKGSLELMSSETSLPTDVDKTIDNLAKHIRERLKAAISSGTLTDEVKAEILNDLRILQNEIAVQQNMVYSATTMKASTVQTNKKAYEQFLNAFEARAKKANVFEAMSQDISDLRTQLNNVEDANGLNNFVENLKVARNKFQAETAKFAQEKQTAKELDDLYSKLAKSYAEMYRLQQQLNSGTLGKNETEYVKQRLQDEQKIAGQIHAEIAAYGESVDQNKLLNAVLEERKNIQNKLNEQSAKAADKEQERIDKQNKNYGKTRFNTETRNYDKLMASVRDIESNSGLSANFQKQIDAYEDAYRNLERLRKQFENDPNAINNKQLTKEFQDAALETERLRKGIQGIVNESYKLEQIDADSIIGKSFWNVSEFAKAKDAMKAFADEVSNGLFKFDSFNKTGTEMYGTIVTSSGVIEKLTIALSEANGEMVAFTGGSKSVASAFEQVKSSVSGSITNGVKKLAATYLGFHDIIRYLRQGYQYVKDIDLAMTELKKVTDETEESYARFLKTASSVAGSIGSTVTDFTTVTSDFARLGYTIEEASELARTALIYENVGDGFADVNEASQSIISTMKAFGIEADHTMGIVDRFNEVGNNFAIDSKGIGDALQRSASALVEGGNSIDEAIGLVTAANSVIQNPEQVGTALKTLTLRLRGAKVELEEAGLDAENMATSVSSLREKLLALTDGKVDIMLDENTFKNTTQILREMSAVWEEMSDIEQASALELMGGKRQANILSSMITNFDTVEEVIQTSANSAGSAIRENEKYLDSIQGKIDQFNNSLQTMWMNFLDSEIVKVFVDIGRHFVEWIDQIGVIESLVIGIVGYLSMAKKINLSKYFGLATKSIHKLEGEALANEIDKLNEAISNGPEAFNAYKAAQQDTNNGIYEMITNTQQATYSVDDYMDALRRAEIRQELINSAIVLGITAVSMAVSALEEYIAGLDTLQEEYDELQSSISSLEGDLDTINSELSSVQEQIDALSGKKLTLTEAEDLKRLKEQSAELERQKLLKEKYLEVQEEQNEAKSLAMVNRLLQTTAANQERATKEAEKTGQTWGKTLGWILGIAAVAGITLATGGTGGAALIGAGASASKGAIASALLSKAGIALSVGTATSSIGGSIGGLAGNKTGGKKYAVENNSIIEWYESYEKAIEEATNAASDAEQTYFSDMTEDNYEKWQNKVDEIETLQAEMYEGLENLQEYIGNLEYNDQTASVIDSYNQLLSYIDVKSNKGDLDAQISAIKGLQPEYYQLSKGVDENGNNVALSAEEYARYLNIVEQIVAYTPSIVQGYDAQGNAILNYNTLIADSIDLLKEQQRQAAQSAVSDEALIKVVKSAKKHYDNTVQNLENNAPTEILRTDQTAIWGNEHSSKVISDIIGVNKRNFQSDTSFVQENIGKILENRDEIIQKITDEMKKNSEIPQGQIDAYIKSYNSWLDVFATSLHSAEERANQKIRETLYMVPQSSENYDNLSGSQIAFVNSYIMSLEDLKDQSESNIKEIRDTILNLTDFIASDAKTQGLIDDLFALDASTMPVQKYVDEFNSIWGEIIANVDIPKDKQDALKNQLFPDMNDVKTMQTEVAKKLTDNSSGLVKNLSLPELRIAYRYLLEEADGSLTFEEMKQKISEYSDEIDGPVVQSYSILKQKVADFNEFALQTSDIVLNNTEVTQEYKDALIELGVSSEDLAECFDDTNKLVVTNAEKLQELTDKARKNTAQNAKLAKSQARLQYYELYKEMKKYISSTGEIVDGKKDEILALYAEMNAIEKVIAKYSMLEAQLLGATSAYDKLAAAQEADEEIDFGSKAEELVNVLGQAFNTAELGTEAAQVAFEGLIPDDVIDKTKTLDEQMSQAYSYFTKGTLSKLFKIEFDDEGAIQSVEMTKKNVESFVKYLIDAGDVFQGTWDEFTLNPEIETLGQFADAIGVTEEVAFAFLTELEKYDIGWIGGEYSTLLDQFLASTTDGQIQLAIQDIADLNAKLANGVIDAEEYAKQFAVLNQNLESAKSASRVNMFGSDGTYDTNLDNIDGYLEANQKVIDAQDDLKEKTDEYTMAVEVLADAKEQGREATEEETKAAEDAQKAVEDATGVLENAIKIRDKFTEPSEAEIQIAIDDIEAEIAAAGDKFDKALAENFELDDNGYYVIKANLNTADLESKYPGIVHYVNLLNSRTQLTAYGDATPLETTLSDISDQLKEIVSILESLKLGLDPTSVDSVQGTINELIKTKTIPFYGIYKGIVNGGKAIVDWINGDADVDGTAHANGTAYVKGNWGAPKTETALVGELGPEMRVRGSRWELIGQHGAEFTDVRKGDIIFNHKQTEDLLSKGHVTGRGKAYSHGTSGTAYAFVRESGTGAVKYANAHKDYNVAKKEQIAAKNVVIQSNSTTVDYKNAQQEKFTSTAAARINTWDDAYNKVQDDYKGETKTSGSGGDKDDSEQLIDFIEIKLEEIEHEISHATAKLENYVDDTSQEYEKSKQYDRLVAEEKNKRNTYEKADDYYTKKANELLKKVNKDYQEMAQNGAIAIKDFVGEKEVEQAEAIQEYRDMAAKANDAEVAALESIARIEELRLEEFNDLADDYDNVISLIEAESDLINAQMDLQEEAGERLSAKYYDELVANTNETILELQDKRVRMQKDLADAVKSGEVKKGSDTWYEMVNAIADVDEELIQCEVDLESFQNEINNLKWDNFDKLIDQFDNLDSELSHLYDRFTDVEEAADKKGVWNDKSIAALGVAAQQMELAQKRAEQYAKAIEELTEDYEAELYSTDEYNEKLAELKEGQWESIEAYEEAKDAIMELNEARIDAIKEGIEEEIDAYQELIDKKKEALDADKDLHDFEKDVAEQQKNIATIERKIAALRGDSSASAAAQRKQLEAELLEAKADLEETYYDRSIENQKTALDQEAESFEESKNNEMEALDEWLKNEEAVIFESLNTVKANTDIVLQEIKDLSSQYGIDISNSLVSPWEDGAKAIDGYKAKFSELSSSFADEVDNIIREQERLQEEADRIAKEAVNSAKNKVNGTKNSGSNKNSSSGVDADPVKDNNTKQEKEQEYIEYTVKKGDTLWDIAKDKTGSGTNYKDIAAANDNIKDPNKIYVGQTIKIPKYAKGTFGTKSDEFAWIDEIGEELVLHAGANGKLSYLTKGSSVIPADLTSKLMDLALDPTQTLENSRPIISAPKIVNNEINVDMHFGEVVHIDTVTNDTIPDLTKAIEKQMDKYMKQVNNQIRKYTR